jgi:hypothetical protein
MKLIENIKIKRKVDSELPKEIGYGVANLKRKGKKI